MLPVMIVYSLVATVLVLISGYSQAIILDCTYAEKNIWQINKLYTCTGRVIIVGDLHIITHVSNNHLSKRDNGDVKGVSIRNQELDFAPRNLGEFFPNLESLDISQSKLKEIRREDLENLPNLKQLHLNNNNIQFVEKNLFENNPQLHAISFLNNPVKHVAYSVFDNLSDLKSLRFEGTTCINLGYDKNRAKVETLISQLAKNCAPTFEMTEAEIINGVELRRKVYQLMDEKDKHLEWELMEIKRKLKQLEEW
ncbi:CLUMA_CG001852, isoform A, partial [Clunio marinus]